MKFNTFTNRLLLSLLFALPSYILLFLIRGYQISEITLYAHIQYTLVVFFILVSIFEFHNLKSRVLEGYIAWKEKILIRAAVEVFSTITFTPLVVTCFMIILYNYIWSMQIWWPGILEYNLFAIVFSFLIAGFVNSEVILEDWKSSLIRNQFLEKENIKAKLGALQAQISPHFLFNNFNVISSLIEDDPDLARLYLDRLSAVYRYILSTKREELIDLTEELEFIEKYIFLLKVRFNDKINYKVEIEYSEAYKIPPATLQLIVENAVKHNEISSRKPLHITIFEKEGFLITQNNLQPKSTTNLRSTGVGLSNLKERYKYLSDREIEIEKTEKKFSVAVPLIHSIYNESSNM